MIKVLLISGNDTEALASELMAYTELSLTVISREVLNGSELARADIAVSDEPITSQKPVILICDKEQLVSVAADADDFVLRPVCAAELYSRILRLIAPVTRKTELKIFKSNGLTVDFESALVHFSGTQIHLTLFEYKLICLLAQSHGRLVTYDEILHSLWESPIGNEMLSIRVFINAIRHKLAAAGAMNDMIRTHAGKGYSLN